MGVLEDAAEIASNLGRLVSPSSYEMPWNRFPKGIMDPAYILQGIGPAFQEASAIYQTLDLPDMDPAKAASAWKIFADETVRIKKETLANAGLKVAFLTSTGLLPLVLSYKVATSAFGGLIAALFFTSAQGAFGHIALKDANTQQYSIHKMVIDGDLPEETAVAHAGWCYTGFRLITLLNNTGALRPLKKSGTAGLGALPLVPLIIGAAVVVCIIAGAIVLSKNLSEVNVLQARVIETKLELMKDACAKTNDPKIIAECARGPTKDDLMGGSLASGISDAISKVGSDLAKYLVIAGAIYLGAMMLPALIGKAKDAKEAVTA